MKRNVTATLLALALLCGLATGCGSRNDKNNNGGGNTTVTTPDKNNGIMDDVEQGLENAGDALTGNNGNNGVQNGVPYDELLNDGRVHDTDGNLNDGENPSSARNRSK